MVVAVLCVRRTFRCASSGLQRYCQPTEPVSPPFSCTARTRSTSAGVGRQRRPRRTGDVERVLHLARRVVLRLEQRVEIPERRLHQRRVPLLEPQVEEGAPGLLDDPLQRVALARMPRLGGEVDVVGLEADLAPLARGEHFGGQLGHQRPRGDSGRAALLSGGEQRHRAMHLVADLDQRTAGAEQLARPRRIAAAGDEFVLGEPARCAGRQGGENRLVRLGKLGCGAPAVGDHQLGAGLARPAALLQAADRLADLLGVEAGPFRHLHQGAAPFVRQQRSQHAPLGQPRARAPPGPRP